MCKGAQLRPSVCCSARQHVPVEEYVRTLKSFVLRIQSLGTQNVVLMTPPPVDEEVRIRENKQVTSGPSC